MQNARKRQKLRRLVRQYVERIKERWVPDGVIHPGGLYVVFETRPVPPASVRRLRH